MHLFSTSAQTVQFSYCVGTGMSGILKTNEKKRDEPFFIRITCLQNFHDRAHILSEQLRYSICSSESFCLTKIWGPNHRKS